MNPQELMCAAWRTSSHSGTNTNCVEVAPLAGGTAVRDSQHRDGGTLLVSRAAWTRFRTNVPTHPRR